MDVSGTKLSPDEKYDLSEAMLNDYEYQLNLTVKALSREDFGGYTCSAKNVLGEAEGTIRLQGDDRSTIPEVFYLISLNCTTADQHFNPWHLNLFPALPPLGFSTSLCIRKYAGTARKSFETLYYPTFL